MTIYEFWSLIVSIATLVAWSVYVLFTIMTFREIQRQTKLQSESFEQIKRQTDLQSEALLSVSASIRTNAPTERPLHERVQNVHARWREILKTQAPTALNRPDQLVVLHLKNRGRSDIVDWKIQVALKVEPGPHLATTFQTQGNDVNWEVNHVGSRDIVDAQGEQIDVAIAPTGKFPLANFRWTIEYTDAKGKAYTHFVGDHEVSDTNAFATTAPQPQPPPDVTPPPSVTMAS